MDSETCWFQWRPGRTFWVKTGRPFCARRGWWCDRWDARKLFAASVSSAAQNRVKKCWYGWMKMIFSRPIFSAATYRPLAAAPTDTTSSIWAALDGLVRRWFLNVLELPLLNRRRFWNELCCYSTMNWLYKTFLQKEIKILKQDKSKVCGNYPLFSLFKTFSCLSEMYFNDSELILDYKREVIN